MKNEVPFKKIGETLEYKGHLLMVRKFECFMDCEKCFFNNKEICDYVQCAGLQRPDKESVYFVKLVKEGGNDD